MAGDSNNQQFQLPLVAVSAFNAVVDWGDGSVDIITSPTQAETLHTYASAGIYEINITDSLSGWRFDNNGDKDKLINILNWGVFQFDVNRAFEQCSLTTISATDKPFLITTLNEAFFNCSSLGSFDVSKWDLSNCVDLRRAFRGCGQNAAGTFTALDVSNWNVSNVIRMDEILQGTDIAIFDTTSWTTTAMTNMKSAFRQCNDLDYPLDNFDMNGVTDLRDLFRQANGMSTANYDATLISWANQTLSQNEQTDFGDAEYTLGGLAEASRDTIINTYGWTITDGGGV
ncbi:BspA family leucine-rich repeat surface protein [Flavobacteriaceae bacterium]|nr:BspA family leucine-rich repeat surface protein [Flavobacteriaceae bacterium]